MLEKPNANQRGLLLSVNISRMASLLTRIVQEYRPPSLAKKAQQLGPRSDPCENTYLAEGTLTNNPICWGNKFTRKHGGDSLNVQEMIRYVALHTLSAWNMLWLGSTST